MTTAVSSLDRSPSVQKYLGPTGLTVLIALLSAFVPLSTDLYLPALPKMSTIFNVPAAEINLTLTVFFVVYSVGMLLWGPLSDRYGRKPILLIGLVVYVIASIGCACSPTAFALVIFRGLQAAGGSASGAVATAVVKDSYNGRKRETVLAITQSMTLIAPAIAPVLGAYILNVTSWRGVFWILTAIGAVAFAGSLFLTETIPARTTGPVFENIGRLGAVLKNRGFTMLLIVFSIGSISSMAFISSSTFIYQNGFHLSDQVYSFYFAFNAVGMCAGPMLYLRISRRWHQESIIKVCFAAVAACGLANIFLGNLAPYIFAVIMMLSSLAGSCMRPPAANMMLEQQKADTGSVSSIIGCSGMLMGSLGMQLISLSWGNTIIALGVMMLLTSVSSLLIWPLALRTSVRLPGPERMTVAAAEGHGD